MEKTNLFGSEKFKSEMENSETKILNPENIDWEALNEAYPYHIDTKSGFAKGIVEILGALSLTKGFSLSDCVDALNLCLSISEVWVNSHGKPVKSPDIRKLDLKDTGEIQGELVSIGGEFYIPNTLDSIHIVYKSQKGREITILEKDFSKILEQYLDNVLIKSGFFDTKGHIPNDIVDMFLGWKYICETRDRAFLFCTIKDFMLHIKEHKFVFHNKVNKKYSEDSISPEFHANYVKPFITLLENQNPDLNFRIKEFLESSEEAFYISKFGLALRYERYEVSTPEHPANPFLIEDGFGIKIDLGTVNHMGFPDKAILYYDYEFHKLFIEIKDTLYELSIPKNNYK